MKKRMIKIRKIQWLFLLLTALWTMFIWGNSLKTVDASREQSHKVQEYVEPLLEAAEVAPAIRHHIVRKAAHLIEFFTLGLLWTGAFLGKKLYWPLGLCLTTAAVDEGIQLFSPGRGAQLIDIARDFSGSLVAVLLLGLLIHLVRTHHTGR